MKLIEREDSLSKLKKGFDQAKTGRGHCFFVLGESGIGKSVLIKEFLTSIDGECESYIGACDSFFTPRPLAPVIDLAMQLNTGWKESIDFSASRIELFTYFVNALNQKKKTVVIVFEDIHWADEATIDFIKFLSRRITRSGCMFILTCKNNEPAGSQLLTHLLSEIPSDTFTRIDLQLLTQEAVNLLANEKGYNGENIFTLTNGNPFFVNEILESYSPGIPVNVKDAVLSVFNRHTGITKELWQLLSVVPNGLSIVMMTKIDPKWHEAIELCMESKILITNKERIVFKHELYRRTIEESLSPFRRIKLNKTILDLLMPHFHESDEIEKIIHHAKNANENAIVFQYAPIAAKKASQLGAHVEASKLYLTSIQYAPVKDDEILVKIYENYAYESYLINHIKEAIIYQTKALTVWQGKNTIEEIGNSLWFLSRLWWFDGNRKEAEKYAYEAIAIFENMPSSRAMGMAFSNMSQLKMYGDQKEECIYWADKAIAIGKEIANQEILTHALNNMGSVLWKKNTEPNKGKEYLLESLQIALDNGLDEHAARAQSNIVTSFILLKDYASAKTHLAESIDYCEKRDLNSSKSYKYFLKAIILFETGEWKQAEAIIEGQLQYLAQPSAIRIGELTLMTKIKIRRGDQDCKHYLKLTKNMAFITNEYKRILPISTACLEFEWLTGTKILPDNELEICLRLLKIADSGSLNSEFVYWYQKARNEKYTIDNPYPAYGLMEAGHINEAARFWESLNCPFERALTLMEGNEEEKKQAFLIFQEIGATAFAEKLKLLMRSTGIRKIPRGKRISTMQNPAHLTNREIDVLLLIQKGAQNKEIASSLFISSKTVDHHISSLLFKLDAANRMNAVKEGIRLGILK